MIGFSEKLNDIEQERTQIPLRPVELTRIGNKALEELFATLPTIQLHGSLAVSTGLKSQVSGGMAVSVAGDRHPIQTVVEQVDPKDYEAARARIQDESRVKSTENTIFLLGRTSPEMDELRGDIYRCREIAAKYRNDPDQEVRDYCNGQLDRANRLNADLQRHIKRSLMLGSFCFRGQVTPVESLSDDLHDAARKQLASVASQVFDRYAEAPERAGTDLAERFLRVGNLNGITSQLDPLGLVKTQGGQPSINVEHRALISIRDHIDRVGVVEGKSLASRFSDPPYGWSQDTLRYLIAVMLVGGVVKLKVAGREVTVNGQQAIDALKSNNTFKNVGIALREDRPSMAMLALAAKRLMELSGDMVVPLEDAISKSAIKLLPELQQRYTSLSGRLRAVGLPGEERVETMGRDIADTVLTDGSDAPQRFGKEESRLYDSLVWAGEVKNALEQGLESTLRELKTLWEAVESLPNTGIPGSLKAEMADPLVQLKARLIPMDAHRSAADFNSRLTELRGRIRQAAESMLAEQQQRLQQVEQELKRVSEWPELSVPEQQELLARLERLVLEVAPDLVGLKALVNRDYELQGEVTALKSEIERVGRKRQQERIKEEQDKLAKVSEGKRVITRRIQAKAQINSLQDLDAMIQQLQKLRGELEYAHAFELVVELGEDSGNT